MTTERRFVDPTPGRRLPVDLVVLPDLRAIDWDQPLGLRSPTMLERADAALHRWRPAAEPEAVRRERLGRARALRRGEGTLDGVLGERRTSDVELDRMVEAEARATELARSGRMPTLDEIRSVHAILVGRDEPEPFRRDILWYGDSRGPSPDAELHPTAPERVPDAMAQLELAIASSAHVVTKAAIAAAYLPGAHPWSDGNGRMGRILTNWVVAASLDRGGQGPDVAGELAQRWNAAATLKDRWLVHGELDSWVAAVAGAVVQAAPEAPRKWWSSRRRNR